MHLWGKYIDFAEKSNDKFAVNIIIYPKDLLTSKIIELKIKTNNMHKFIFIDKFGTFEKDNPHIPKNKLLHVFLLDEENNVILVGDPLHNTKIEEMFYKMVEERLGKK